MEHTTLIVIKRAQVEEKINKADPLINLFLKMVMRRLRNANALIADHEQVWESGAFPKLHDTGLEQVREKAIDQIKLEQELERALSREELELWYQPIVEATGSCIAGFEEWPADFDALRRSIRSGVNKVTRAETRRRAVVIPVIIEI